MFYALTTVNLRLPHPVYTSLEFRIEDRAEDKTLGIITGHKCSAQGFSGRAARLGREGLPKMTSLGRQKVFPEKTRKKGPGEVSGKPREGRISQTVVLNAAQRLSTIKD